MTHESTTQGPDDGLDRDAALLKAAKEYRDACERHAAAVRKCSEIADQLSKAKEEVADLADAKGDACARLTRGASGIATY